MYIFADEYELLKSAGEALQSAEDDQDRQVKEAYLRGILDGLNTAPISDCGCVDTQINELEEMACIPANIRKAYAG